MKKKLLLIVLALAILTSLTAGTLAVYTRTVMDKDADVVAKRFACSTTATKQIDNATINLAPTEYMEYEFTIANYDEGKRELPAEVPLDFVMTFDFDNAYLLMDGLKAELYEKGGDEPVAVNEGGSLKYNEVIAGGTAAESTYVLVVTWEDRSEVVSEDDAATKLQNSAGRVKTSTALSLTVVATQYTAEAVDESQF